MYVLTLWRVRVTTVAMQKLQMRSLYYWPERMYFMWLSII